MEDTRCTIASIEHEDPRCVNLIRGAVTAMEDPRYVNLHVPIALNMEDPRCWPVAMKTEDPRCERLDQRR